MIAVGDGKGRRFMLVDALDAEWERLGDECRGTVARWSQDHRVLAGLVSLDEVRAAIQGDPDGVLSVLITEGQGGCRVAPRVVLQAMLGKLVRMACSDPWSGVDDYVAALWCRICSYPLAARPHHIAANLVLDTLKAVRSERRWLVRGEVTPWPPDDHLDEICTRRAAGDTLDHGAELSALSADRLIEAARRLGVVDEATGAALVSVYCEGLPGAEAAERLGASAAAVRQRCSRGVRRLTQHASVLLDVA